MQSNMYYTVQNLKEHVSSGNDNVAYSAELRSPSGEVIYVELSPNAHGTIAYNCQNGNVYPIIGVVEQKALSKLKNGDIIVLGECVEVSR